MKTLTLMDLKAKNFLITSLWYKYGNPDRAKLTASGTTKLPNFGRGLSQVRTLTVGYGNDDVHNNNGYMEFEGWDSVLLWHFPDGIGAIGQTITIELYSSQKPSNSGFMLQIEGGSLSKVLYMDGLGIQIESDE